jgi:hypothetical protein
MTMTTGAIATRARAAMERLDQLRAAVEAGVPWPLADRFDHAPEAAWGPNEVLAHLGEMVPFWLGEVARILDASPGPTPFGRVGTDPIRIALIGRDRTLPIAELFTRVHAGLDRGTLRLQTLTPAQLAKVGLHPRLGEMTVAAIIERMILGHLEEHVKQLETILGTVRTPD